MYLKTLKLGDIHPYDRNPRINDRAVEPVMKSIQKDGYRARIIVDTDGVIIAGHTRYKAMQKLGWTEAEVWVADDMTEEQIRDYRIRDNHTAGFAEWDFDLLEGEIEGLDFDMSEFGVGASDEYEEPPEPEAIEDNFDPDEDVPDESGIVQGDLFILGNHRLLCGDSTRIDDVEKLMGGAKADLFLTDPPYNINYEEKQKNLAVFRDNKRVNNGSVEIENDYTDDASYVRFLYDVFSNANLVMREGAAFYIWHAIIHVEKVIEAIKKTGWQHKQQLVWVKSVFSLTRMDYQYRHEVCWYGWKNGRHYFTERRNESTVIDDRINPKKLKKEEMLALLEKLLADKVPTTVLYEDKPLFNDIHPTMKPIKLMARLIANSSKPGWNVLDLFGGSGSTMMACEQLGRTCYTMETSPTYCAAMINRWQKYTGEQVYRLVDGQMVPYDVDA